MLQRAATSAYSWWWASHVRTKQSKWLEQNLQDMEDKVQYMVKLIDEDGDSFAKRAEMYYKRRPELISCVEDSFKTFRALADRYDILSKELQNANNTIATVCPEHVQFAIPEDEGDPDELHVPTSNANAPQVPKPPHKELKRIIHKATKQHQAQKLLKRLAKNEVKSGLNKEEAHQEINKLHKDILALQTIKEFVKSSYESGLQKYWGIENQITGMQQRVSMLQDEFSMGAVIEDDEARTLMAQAAIRSCQETLTMLQEKQEKATREAREEYKRIGVACERLQSLRKKYLEQQADEGNLCLGDKSPKMGHELQSSSKHLGDLIHETNEIEYSSNERFDLTSMVNLTVTQMAEKIDHLVDKVINLETAVSSQTVLVNTLRAETDDLNAQIQTLEDQRGNLVDEAHDLGRQVVEMEEKLSEIQDLNENLESQNNNLQTNFAVARSNLDHLTEKLSSVKPDEGVEHSDSLNRIDSINSSEEKLLEEVKDVRNVILPRAEESECVKEVDIDVECSNTHKQEVKKESTSSMDGKLEEEFRQGHPHDLIHGDEDQASKVKSQELNWQQLLLSGVEDRDKILLKEYTIILRNYKDVKRKLSEMEKKERENQFDVAVHMRELKQTIQNADEEIWSLREQLNSLQGHGVVQENISLPKCSSRGEAVRNVILDMNGDADIPTVNEEIKLVSLERNPSISKVEQGLRMDIDALLDKNLDFWLKFSAAFHQIQKFKTEVSDLQVEVSKLVEKRKPDGTTTSQLKSEARPVYKHLKEIQTELAVWLEQSVSLKDELNRRFASLCDIQEEITRALREGVQQDEIKFSSHQAAKFQGEVLNMEQENNMVREELQAGVDHVRVLQLEVEKTLRILNDEFRISSDQPENIARCKVPLRSFLFGTKVKRPKNSIFSSMHPSRRYQILRASLRLTRH